MKKCRLVIPKDEISNVQCTGLVEIEDEFGNRLDLEKIGKLALTRRAIRNGHVVELVLEFYVAEEGDEHWIKT